MHRKRMLFLLGSLILTALVLGYLANRLKPKQTVVQAPAFKATCSPAQLEELYSSALFLPHVIDAQTVGFIVTKVKPESPWAKWGLEAKDVVHKVNGKAVTDAATFLGGIGALCEKGARVDYTRAQQSKSFTVN